MNHFNMKQELGTGGLKDGIYYVHQEMGRRGRLCLRWLDYIKRDTKKAELRTGSGVQYSEIGDTDSRGLP